MELHQLKSFYYTATYLNFTRAAKKVSLSQPAVSRQIEALEKYFQLPLFTRIGKKIDLTDAGRRLLQFTEQILQLTEETEKAMHSLTDLDAGELHIGAGTTAGNYILPTLVMKFKKKYPDIQLNMTIDKTFVIIEKLKQGELDAAIIAKSDDHSEFNYKALIQENIFLLTGGQFMDDNAEINELSQLSGHTFLLRNQGSNTRDSVNHYFATHNFSPEKIIDFDTNEAIKQAAISGYGIGCLSEYAVKHEMAFNLLVPFHFEVQLQRYYSLVFPKGKFTSPSLLIFSSFLNKNIYRV